MIVVFALLPGPPAGTDSGDLAPGNMEHALSMTIKVVKTTGKVLGRMGIMGFNSKKLH
ncbi:MAG: hypothetical protein ABI790_01015 [Betaproteobacteria bacterium]